MRRDKKIVIGMICVLIALLLGVVALMSRNISFADFDQSVNYDELQLVQEVSFDVSDVRNLVLDTVSAEVIINEVDGDEVKMTQYANYSLKSNEKFNGSKAGNTLTIKQSNGFWLDFNFFNWNRQVNQLIVDVPREYIDDLRVDVGSGKISFDTLNQKNVSFDVASGKIEGRTINSERLDVDVASGKVLIDATTANGKVELTSGKVDLGVANGNFDIEITSGDFYAKNYAGLINVDITSGKINLDALSLTDGSTFKVLSGKGEINLAESNNYCYVKDVVSGKINTPSGQCNGSYPTIKIDITSGKININ